MPRRLLPHYGNVMLDLVRQEPGPGGALLQGLFFGRIAPHRSERRTFKMPTLVLGHRRDPVHPFSDAGMLAEELPNGRLLEADSLVELRMRPERLTGEIASFLDEVWAPRRGRRRQAPGKRRAKRARLRQRAASRASRLFGREQFEFVDAHVAGRLGVPIAARGGPADPQRHEAKRLRGGAELEAQMLDFTTRAGRQLDPGRVGDRGGQRGRWRRRPARSCPGVEVTSASADSFCAVFRSITRPSAIFGATAGSTCAVQPVEVSPSIARLGSPKSLAG